MFRISNFESECEGEGVQIWIWISEHFMTQNSIVNLHNWNIILFVLARCWARRRSSPGPQRSLWVRSGTSCCTARDARRRGRPLTSSWSRRRRRWRGPSGSSSRGGGGKRRRKSTGWGNRPCPRPNQLGEQENLFFLSKFNIKAIFTRFRNYKPMEIRPSEKPLTLPASPNFSMKGKVNSTYDKSN